MTSFVPRIPVGDWVERGVDWLEDNAEPVLDAIKDAFTVLPESLASGLLILPPLVVAALFAVLAWLVRSPQFAVFVAVSLTIIVSMQLWEPAMQTLAMVIVAALVAIIISLPLGILAARNATFSGIVRPVLDLMQTMPALVYLVPVVIFFSLGYPGGVVATIVFSLPPGVRLTELAIRQVDAETVEAGEAFGGTSWQILRGVQLPLGLPTIMAGINQVILLGLSMAVMAGFVGAPGLGKLVVQALSTVDVASGAEAGLAIVFLAILLDRLTASIGQETGRSLWEKIRRRGAVPT